jgi:hypothetical protein
MKGSNKLQLTDNMEIELLSLPIDAGCVIVPSLMEKEPLLHLMRLR